MTGRPEAQIDLDEAVEAVFPDKKSRHIFVLRAIAASRRDRSFAFGLWKTICKTPDPAKDRQLARESLGILSVFYDEAREEFYKRTWRTELPSIATLAQTLETRKPVYTGVEGQWAHEPATSRWVRNWLLTVLGAVLVFSTGLAVLNCNELDFFAPDLAEEFFKGLAFSSVLGLLHIAGFILPGVFVLRRRKKSSTGTA